MSRIAIGGFQHETNTFAPSKAGYPAFEAGGGWPGVQYGEPIFRAVEGANIPAAGAIQALRAMGHTLVGTAWAAASPSAHVTADAFERILGGLVQNLEAAGKVDGVYLDLHGAITAPWCPRSTRTAKVRSCAASARQSGRACRSWRASTCTPT